jgi:REP element-mobilizing transposase RayT
MSDNLVKYLAWKRKRAMYANQTKEDGPSVCAVTLLVTGGRRVLEEEGLAEAVMKILKEVSLGSPFELLAYSLLPDHMNLLILARSPEASVKRFISEVRVRSSKAFRKFGGEGKLWEDHFFDHTLAVGENLELVARKVHQVPVEKGLVAKAEDWAYAWMASKMPW